MAKFRNKALAALLAAAGGGLGLHRFYLGLRAAWLPPLLLAAGAGLALRSDPWYQSPGFFVAALPVVVGFVEAIVLALTGDERFDARYNPGAERHNRSGWGAVLVAVGTMIVGSIIALTAIVLLVQTIVEKRQAAGIDQRP